MIETDTVTEATEDDLRDQLRELNHQLLELTAQAEAVESKIARARLALRSIGKQLQAREAEKSKVQIAAGGAEARTRPRKHW